MMNKSKIKGTRSRIASPAKRDKKLKIRKTISSKKENKTEKLPGEKRELVESVARRAGDTGSVEVQIALLTKRVGELTEHLKLHKKDLSSRRGLLGLVNKRRKLLMYLLKRDEKRYQSITKKLGLTK